MALKWHNGESKGRKARHDGMLGRHRTDNTVPPHSTCVISAQLTLDIGECRTASICALGEGGGFREKDRRGTRVRTVWHGGCDGGAMSVLELGPVGLDGSLTSERPDMP